jgi:mRNA interferase HigB
LTDSSQNERMNLALNRFQSRSWIAAEAMHLISIRNLRQDSSRYPHLKKVIDEWYSILRKAQWQSLEDVRRIFRDAEAVGNFTVFNIKGNDFRLIVGIDYENQVVYYKYLLTHAEYDKDRWKNDPYF